MSTEGNRVAKQLALLLDCVAKMQSWLRYQGRRKLEACPVDPLQPGFARRSREARLLAEFVGDFVAEWKVPGTAISKTTSLLAGVTARRCGGSPVIWVSIASELRE